MYLGIRVSFVSVRDWGCLRMNPSGRLILIQALALVHRVMVSKIDVAARIDRYAVCQAGLEFGEDPAGAIEDLDVERDRIIELVQVIIVRWMFAACHIAVGHYREIGRPAHTFPDIEHLAAAIEDM